MPQSNRKRRQRLRTLRQSTRQITKATRKVLSELTPAQRRAGTSARPILKQASEEFPHGALSTHPNITYAVSAEGKTLFPTTDLRRVARHEVSHHLGTTPASLSSIRFGFDLTSAFKTQQVVRLAKEPISRQRVRRIKEKVLFEQKGRPRESKTLPRQGIQGFNTPQLTKVIKGGTPSQQKRARMLSRKLGRRVKKRGIDF